MLRMDHRQPPLQSLHFLIQSPKLVLPYRDIIGDEVLFPADIWTLGQIVRQGPMELLDRSQLCFILELIFAQVHSANITPCKIIVLGLIGFISSYHSPVTIG